MSWLRRLFTGDEELGKKDDDHRPQSNNLSSSSWSARKTFPAFRKTRIIYGICLLLFIYLFVKNIPDDLGPSTRDFNPRLNQGGKLPEGRADPPANKPRRPTIPSEAEEHYHDGPIKFYKLASSLHSVARLGGQHDSNKNVFFAASSLKSASEIIPLACEMARWDRNDVHFAIMGRDDMEIQEIRSLNGAVDDCNVHWHDARPDYSRWSSDFRMEVSVEASMEHIQTFIHPQVIIIDNPSREDAFFVTTLRTKSKDIGKPIIELPLDATENMLWLTRLDSGSLAAWSTIYVDLLIQAPSGSSGSLVRLLKSIESADYPGTRRPHLTIELPAEIDAPTWRYLENFVWPPVDSAGASHASQISLRHRIPRRTQTEYEASARLIESFYPVRTKDSHVLLLSPQIELSPLYYHYLIYHLLEYKYSAHGKENKNYPNLMGISLELPTHFLNDSEPLVPPRLEKPPSNRKGGTPGEPTPFLWQAPNSNAALYFGDKWMEFHSFLTARLSKPPTNRTKFISKKHPSWLEFLLELMRARRYSLLYPTPIDDEAIAVVHDELYQVPEEFPREPSTSASVPELNPDEPLSLVYEKKDRPPPNTEHSISSSTLISILPNSGDLPDIPDLPLLAFDGSIITQKQANDDAWSFTEAYRRDIGGCKAEAEISKREPNSALDLFCHLDQVYDPMNVQTHDSKALPPRGKPQKIPPVDEDVIPAGQKESAKREASEHLARQAGRDTASQLKEKGDNDKETQEEFKTQMERQKKQAENGEEKVADDKGKKDESEAKKQEPVGDPRPTDALEKGPGW